MKDPGEEKLQQAWRERAATGRPGTDCPDPEAIWEALRGGLGEREAGRIVRHTASCPACAEAWRLAREMGAMEARSAGEPAVVRVRFDRRDRRAPRLLMPLALAAGLALLLGIGAAVVFMGQEPEDPGVDPGKSPGVVMRTTGTESIRPKISEDMPLPKDAFRLAWSPGPEGTRYTVRITTRELETVHLAEGLSSNEHTVPATVLDDLAPGTRLLWQVQAFYPDGRRVTSPTFFVTIQ